MMGKTTLEFRVVRPGRARLDIFDVRGRLVRRLFVVPLSLGANARAWDGYDDRGIRVANGTYIARLLNANGATTTRVILLRR